jgi:hypothetical protein
MWDFLSSIADSVGGDIAALWSAIIWLANAILAVFTYLWNLIKDIFNFFVDLLRKIGHFFHTLWDQFFKKIFTGLWSALVKVHAWLEAHLGPVVKFIGKVRAYLDRIFRLYIKPFLNMIQHIRQYLQILRLLGVKWAAALDAKLGKFEADIAGLFLTVRGILTGFIGLLNVLADPLNLFRRPTAVLSIRRIIPSLIKVSTGLPIAFFMPSPRFGAPLGVGQLPLNFNPADPFMNPPASTYFSGDDGLGGFSGFTDGTIPDDTSVDTIAPLDYFDDSLYSPPDCTDLATCIQVAVQTGATVPIVSQG